MIVELQCACFNALPSKSENFGATMAEKSLEQLFFLLSLSSHPPHTSHTSHTPHTLLFSANPN
ncbi:MAG: hypothetical protein WBA93_26660 [Microcoleaceae cyanobacterium]